MNISQAWVALALQTLSCKQKHLAKLLSVSPTQIRKWKNGEDMSTETEDKFRAITRIGDNIHPEFALWAGSVPDAARWNNLIHHLAEHARDHAETGYVTAPLLDEMGRLSLLTSSALTGMGIEPPRSFPPELDQYFRDDRERVGDGAEREDEEAEEAAFEADDVLRELLDASPYSKVIAEIFHSLNEVYGFYAAYILELTEKLTQDGEPSPCLFDLDDKIESSLMDLAASKIDVDERFAPRIGAFRNRVRKNYEEWLTALKDAAFRAGIPLKAELIDMVSKDAGELGDAAEAERLGLHANRLHPDVYMNELLVGMRVIHQALPAIMRKLGIEDFELDESTLGSRV